MFSYFRKLVAIFRLKSLNQKEKSFYINYHGRHFKKEEKNDINKRKITKNATKRAISNDLI